MLTPRQKEALAFIKAYQARHEGVSPSLEEIGHGLGLASKNGVFGLLQSLERRGFIERTRRRARSIRVCEPHSPEGRARIALGRSQRYIEDGQYVVKTLTSRDELEDPASMGGDFGYWLCRYSAGPRPGMGEFVAVAKFTDQTEAETFLYGPDKPIVYWPEE
jgi:DNA-binding MarR family transcriptional regulator